MFDFFNKRKKRKFLSELRARRHAEDDLLTPEQKEAFDGVIAAFADSDPKDFKNAAAAAVERSNRIVPPYSWLRNLLDLLIVVGAVAFGIRGLFFQPFKIPTGSMQPTLYGIHYMESTPLGKKLPSFLNYALFSARRARLEVKESGEVVFHGYSNGFFSDNVEFSIGSTRYTLPGAPRKVMEYSGLEEGSSLSAGVVKADGFLSLGDHLFVERFSLYLAPVKRGDIMVFSTRGLHDSDGDLLSQSGFYYVKRVAALPGDTVKITGSQLYVKPRGADSFVPVQSLDKRFEKIYSGRGGYQGHQSGMGSWPFANGREYTLPDDGYLMLGDNTAFSKDSRYFGPVPHRNLIGRPGWVFWPFSRRWGWSDQVSALPEPTGEAMYTTFKVMWKQ